MKQSPRYNFRYPELTDQISAYPPDVAAENALLLDQVIGGLADTTTEALAGKAPTTHTHTMGQVDGLDTALAGKAAQATLDTRVPSALALRLDTTVGTRIMAGSTMIYGDTGWRNINDLLDPAITITGGLAIRRTDDTVYFRLRGTVGKTISLRDGFMSRAIPVGFRSPNRQRITFPGLFPAGTFFEIGGNSTLSFFQLDGTTWTMPETVESIVGFYVGTTAWPTTLPGTPA